MQIIKYFTDNDLYKFTTMNAVQRLYPNAMVKYKFINRNKTAFPEGFAEALRKQVDGMKNLRLSGEEEQYLRDKCYFFDPVFIDLLKGYRYDPSEVTIHQENGRLEVEIEGYWYRTVLWEVPVMAIISELYFKMTNQSPVEVEERAERKARQFKDLQAEYSEFGTRRRFSFEVHDRVFKTLTEYSGDTLKGTSNVYLAMKYDSTPIGTHPHEWFMYHAAHYGYKAANIKGLEAWTDVYNGDLGIALTDTYTTSNFFANFSNKYAKLFDGVRWDSGDALQFTDTVLDFYASMKIDAKAKTVVYSDGLDMDMISKIKKYVDGRVHDVYGIGTHLTNDVGAKPLNMVIKLTEVKPDAGGDYVPTVKLSDVKGKNTGTPQEIELCRKTLGLSE
ncbi:nicotinate phosphoribosyltransferase [Marinilabiliaceae bacterium JC017]|nr:nicotinate phosphoribosyltransferase [Marinilabiliaceae bacterium JC017]